MGKRKSRKKQFNMNKVEFSNKICGDCGICGFGCNPSFCYDQVYLVSPKKFSREILTNLKLNGRLHGKQVPSDEDIQYIFESSVCASNFCGTKPKNNGKSCINIIGCLSEFRRQMSGAEPVLFCVNHRGRKLKNKGKGRKNIIKQTKKPLEPSFFCNDGFKEELEKILHELRDHDQQSYTAT